MLLGELDSFEAATTSSSAYVHLASYSTTQLFFMWLTIAWWVFMVVLSVLGYLICRFRYVEPKPSISSRLSPSQAKGVSILRPIKGVDYGMRKNLASSLKQDYPLFEVIFSVATADDPAIDIVKEVIAQHPQVDTRLIIGESLIGVNPKINNLIRGYNSAKYDIIWILDSNIFTHSGCLGRSVDKLTKPKVGLVHHAPFGVKPNSFGSELELMFLNTAHAKMYNAINFASIDSCVVGKSNMFRKSVLERVGGLSAFKKYLAEDNEIAQAIWDMGYKHEMTQDLAYQSLGSMKTVDYFKRRARWIRLRKYMVTTATLVEPFTESIVCGLLASYGFHLLWKIHPLSFFAFHMIFWFLNDLNNFQVLMKKPIRNIQDFVMAWSLREIAAFPLWAYAMSGSRVEWRGSAYCILPNRTVTPCRPNYETPMTTLRKYVKPTFIHHLQAVFIGAMTYLVAFIHIMTDILWKSQRNGVAVEEVDHKAEPSLLGLRTWRKLGGLALEPWLEDEHTNSNEEEIPEVILKSVRKYLVSSNISQSTNSC
ncbi:Ceramide glucosyltransferase [Basidiobolus ranarum]|uniref:Ceramide glucosyltransferase n=1 Tax=Basidiobolus ranarum TaxID=34480 RepID=A0ABR2W269_9FUNG